MRLKHLLLASAMVLAPLVAAHADPIYTLGYSNGTSTSYTVLSTGPSTFYSNSYAFDGGHVNLTATYLGMGAFDLAVTTNGTDLPGEVNVFLAESGITNGGLESITGLMTNNTNVKPTAASLGYTLFADNGEGNVLLATNKISGSQGVSTLYVPLFDAASTYSLTQEISVFPQPTGVTNLSLDGSISVPEPGSLALLGTALLGLGLVLRRRSRSV